MSASNSFCSAKSLWGLLPTHNHAVLPLEPVNPLKKRPKTEISAVNGPNWATLAGGGNGDPLLSENNIDVTNENCYENTGHEKTTQEDTTDVAPAFSTPREASAAYQSGQLKSDFSLSSNCRPIRVAFRFVLEGIINEEIEKNEEKCDGKKFNINQDPIYLCWVNQKGVPRHFYKLLPRTTSKDSCDIFLVDEKDHIERTFPGHAFVFCQKIENVDCKTFDNSMENDYPLVVTANGKTMFIRKSTSSPEEGEEEETYLLFGGYRFPKPMERKKSISEKSSDGGHDNEVSSDSDDDESENLVQLVTIKRQITLLNNSNTRQQNKSVEKERVHRDSTADDDDPPPKLYDCSECVPLLRGVINPKIHHKSAFIPTKSDDSIEVPTVSRPPEQTNNSKEQIWEVTVCTTSLDPSPVDTSCKFYNEVVLGGWPCRLEPGCFSDDDNCRTKENDEIQSESCLRERFEADLRAACQSLPAEACAKLQMSTPIWINKSQSFGPKVAPIRGRDACFHPGSKWLVRNGMNPAKCGGVEFYDSKHYLSDCELWGPGGLILHELSHAWHCLHTENGYENEDIKECYKQAMNDGLYDCVAVHGPQGPSCKAYACQNQMEYFAELSVAFLGGIDDDKEHNKWFPFNRSQLKRHDPRAFSMLCRIWKVEENFEDMPTLESHDSVEPSK